MICPLLADAVWLIHLAFIVAGGLLLQRWPRLSWLPWLHRPAVWWGATVELRGHICPLIPKDNRLRQLGGEADDAGGLVKPHLLPAIYPVGLTREGPTALGLDVAALNLAAHARWWGQRREC
ncbi:MAG: DUF2784 domain-containing protein [Dechloromonas sp.]|nr:DUF2784 domain-containing protein [Dechloromonas sp.]